MGPPPGYGSHPPRHRAPIPIQQQQAQYGNYPQTDNMYSMGADQHSQHSMGLGDITGWGSAQPVPPQPYGQMGYVQPTSQPPQRQTQSK
jgi:hypothetical protein